MNFSFCVRAAICFVHIFLSKSNLFSQVLSLDPAVKAGQLANGFRYYIRACTEPKNRAHLYLVNKIGSILETEDQRGLAHFTEHMNFNGTKHFPKNELVNYLEKAGVRFGADLNAYTSFDETVYQLPIPTDEISVLDTGLQIMRDWAQDALLEATEIDKERGVILEEKRLGKGASERLQRQYLPMLFNYSRYAKRLPIGTDEVLTRFQPENLRSFYRDWYRPDLQALIVVGDIDVAAVEKKIKTLFSGLKNPDSKKRRLRYPVVLAGRNQFMALVDHELGTTQLQILIKHKAPVIKTATDYRQSILRSLFNMMIGERYRELLQQSGSPFVNINAGITDFMAGLDMFSINMVVKPGEIKKGFKTALRETERLKQFGFALTELERAKENYLRYMESAWKEINKTPSINYVKAYQQHFLDGQAAPGLETEYRLVQRFIPAISLADMKTIIKEYIKDSNRDILILAPEKERASLPTTEIIDTWISAVKHEKLTVYADQVNDEPLLTSTLKAGTVISEKTITELGITEWIMSNGVKVIVKPTDFRNDEILFRAFSPGGTSLYSDADFQSATNAESVISSFGIGGFDATQLPKKLSGKKLGVKPYISERTEGFSGFTSPEDMETMLQLLYLYFTSPRKDTLLFRSIIERSATLINNRYSDPNNVFTDTVNAVLGNYHVRRSGPTLQKLQQIELEKAYSIYKERFADAADFTFVFTGNIDLTVMKPLLEKYLGALPVLNRNEAPKDLGIRTPTGRIEKTVYKGTESKATVQMVYSGDFLYSQQANITIDALTSILQIKLTERLREVEGGVYSPSVKASYGKHPIGHYRVTIFLGCAPENVAKMIDATEEEILKLQTKGATADDIQKYIAEEQRSYEIRIKKNGFWSSYLVEQYLNEEDTKEILDYVQDVQRVNEQTIKEAANKYLSNNNLLIFKLLPEAAN